MGPAAVKAGALLDAYALVIARHHVRFADLAGLQRSQPMRFFIVPAETGCLPMPNLRLDMTRLQRRRGRELEPEFALTRVP